MAGVSQGKGKPHFLATFQSLYGKHRLRIFFFLDWEFYCQKILLLHDKNLKKKTIEIGLQASSVTGKNAIQFSWRLFFFFLIILYKVSGYSTILKIRKSGRPSGVQLSWFGAEISIVTVSCFGSTVTCLICELLTWRSPSLLCPSVWGLASCPTCKTQWHVEYPNHGY